jgi:hypothetical protein
MEAYTHAPRTLVETELFKTNLMESEKMTVFSEDGELIGEHLPKRRYEFDGTLYRYYSDIAKYLCTHHKADLKDMITRYGIRIKWETFVKMAIGEHQDQYHRFIDEMGRNVREPKYCYIPKQDGGCFLMIPFILDFESADKTALSDKEKKQLLQLSKKDGVERRKIGYVTFAFAEPLFQQYIAGGQYYQHPAAFYAESYRLFSEFNERKEFDNPLSLKELDANVDAYIAFIDYLYLHGAGTHDKITVNMYDMIRHVIPSAAYEKNGKPYMRDKGKFGSLLGAFGVITRHINGLDYRIEDAEPDEKVEAITFYLSHKPKRKASWAKRTKKH